MGSIISVVNRILGALKMEWKGLDWSNLSLGHYYEAIIFILILALFLTAVIFLGYSKQNIPGRTFVALPGIMPSFKNSYFSAIRHLPVFLFFVGLGFFTIAFADPYHSFSRDTVSVRGQKIAILVDSSGSMNFRFDTEKLNTKMKQSFFTAIAAAEMFVKLRMKKNNNDLISFILFGGESYVITPFTPDYRNILTSLSLVGEPKEYARFPDKNTVIAQSISQATRLFKSFNFINSSGNAIVLFSDGEDGQYLFEGRSLGEILSSAKEGKIPVYFIRVRVSDEMVEKFTSQNFNTTNLLIQDEKWKAATEATGGKFYAGEDENIILKAVDDLDKNIKGDITTTRYVSKKPYFLIFLAAAFAAWTFAAGLGSIRLFSTFP